MRDPRDTLDVQIGPPGPGEVLPDGSDGAGAGAGVRVGQGRPFLQLWFRCAGQYARAYRNSAGTGYIGRCPTCAKAIRFRVGSGGTSERFFEISC